jgi:hypothetical protein
MLNTILIKNCLDEKKKPRNKPVAKGQILYDSIYTQYIEESNT